MIEPPDPLNESNSEVTHEPLWEAIGFGWKLTYTGHMWLNTPWKLIYRKKLRLGLMELLVFMVLWGSGNAYALSGMLKRNTPIQFIITFVLVILYLYLLGFAAALYRQKTDPDSDARTNLLWTIFYMSAPTILCHLFGAFVWSTLQTVPH